MEDEIPVVIQRLKANPDIYNLGILLTFRTGLRVGELSTLKKKTYTDVLLKSDAPRINTETKTINGL